MNRFKVVRREKPNPPTKRAIDEVEEWDGSASNYEDTEAYCAACLIDVNDAAGNETKKQSHCMLPVKAPGSSQMADKAILASTGGRGITAVKKPADVDQADWDQAVQKAAKTLVGAYGQLDREPPETLTELAGTAQRAIGASTDQASATLTARSLMLEEVGQQVNEWSYAEPDRPWLASFFLERGNLYGLFNSRGQLYRATLDLGTDGHTVEVGTMEPVMHQFTPIARSLFRVARQANGDVRFFMVAGTAVVNRVGEIDSTKLYDDMIARAEENDFYPTLDYWHLGEEDQRFEFGQFDFLAREGVVYLGSGLLQKGHPLAIALEGALERDPDYWGASIEYYRPQERGIEYVNLGELEIPVYTVGLNTRISVLPEVAAASWFTQLSKETREMNDKQLKALRSMFGDDEKGFNSFIASIGSINAEVRDKNIISRSTEQATEEPAGEKATEEPATTTDEGASLETTIDLDDAAIQAIVAVARQQVESQVLGTVTAGIEAMTANLTKLLEQQTSMLGTVNGLVERVGSLEQTDEQKQRAWQQDLPARVQNPTRVTYRPRDGASKTEPVQRTSQEQASAVLATLPKVSF